MKIHIVQKGDTLWNIANKYGVDFQELKAVNTQLSNPDALMPGMKIKVPTGTVHVKKEAQIGGVQKEAQINITPQKEEQVQHPFADITPQPFPVMDIEEEEEELPEVEEEVKGVETGPYIPQMPQLPQMPIMPTMPPQMPQYQPFEIDINNYNIMGMPQVPTPPPNVLPGMLAPEEEDFESEDDYMPEMPQMPQMPPQMQQMPFQQQPGMFNHCVPMTPVMPGYGFNYVPGQQGGFPQQGPFNPMGGFQRTEDVEGVQEAPIAQVQMPQMPQYQPFEIDINNFNVMQMQAPQPGMFAGVEDEMEEMPQMPPQMPPQMAPMQAPPFMGNCVPVSPVMPGYGFNGGFPGPSPFGSGMPMQAGPQAISPAMNNNPVGNPMGMFPGHMNQQMMPSQFYNKKDCGCGGPKPPFVGNFPPQGHHPVGQQPFPGQFNTQPFQGGFPVQQAPYGVNPYQQMPFNPMFNMPDVDDDLDD
ncbi:SafA/ExsA family spore coat assembly protein [Ferdinandcohnia sp. Marseille-Q9671]